MWLVFHKHSTPYHSNEFSHFTVITQDAFSIVLIIKTLLKTLWESSSESIAYIVMNIHYLQVDLIYANNQKNSN